MNSEKDDPDDFDDPDYNPRYREYDERERDYDDPYDDEDDYDDPRYGRRYDGPPQRGSGIKRWLVYLGIGFVVVPLSCCGGIWLLSSTAKDLELSNGQHRGGSAMHVTFDYEIKNMDEFRHSSYTIVVETADGITRDRPMTGWFRTRGTLTFNSSDGGPAESSKSPVKVWIEKSNFRGNRGAASNVLSIDVKTN